MTMVMAMVDGLRVNAARGGHHRAGQRNAHQGDDQFLVHGVVPFSFGCLGLACDQSADNAADDACAEFDPTVVIVVAVGALVAVMTVARGNRATSGLVVSDVMLRGPGVQDGLCRGTVSHDGLRCGLLVHNLGSGLGLAHRVSPDRRSPVRGGYAGCGHRGLLRRLRRLLGHPLGFGRAARLRALGRGHGRTAHRQARETCDHHLLDRLFHNAPQLSVSSFRA